MKILIAEDNAFSRTLLKKTLTKAGYDVITAENGDAAWEVLQQDDPPRLALIDWMMPGLSGVEVCRRVREIDTAFPVYVILLTAKTDKEDVLEGFSAGADDFIKKPFDSGELLARIQVGRRLVEQHALLHCLIDSIPDPIYFKDSRGYYLGCNKAYESFVGKSEGEIISSTAAEVLSPELAKVSHMEDLRVLANAAPLEQEGWVCGADGTQVYHSSLKLPYLESAAGSTGMIGISRDLTKRIRMEQEMRRLAVAVEQSTESIMITDVEGKILYVNAAFETTSGYASGEVLGQTPSLLSSGNHDADFFKKLWGTISAGCTWDGRITNCAKDGTSYSEDAVIYPIRAQSGEVVNYVTISRDITQEMAIEKHLRQQQKMNAIGELAGGISHDFNNILTAILGYVALCMNLVAEDSKTYGYLNEVVKAGDRATKLVRQILTFSRQEEQEFHATELQCIIEDSLSMVQTTMKKSVKVEKDIDADCGPILGDTTQLQQVMVNLCTNASHALGGEAGGVLSVSLKQVEVLGRKSDELQMLDLDPGFYAFITVSDTGCGMPPEVMERVFEPYFTTKKKGEGTGFGLSIVHGIVCKHRGSITVESEEGKGTTFKLYFPLLIGSLEERRNVANQSTLEGYGRLLFVDDDEAVLSMGREILESFGYSVVTATNGRRALEIFRQKPDAFDALVSDYSMPEMNGHELISQCLKIRPELPSILCSGYMEKVEGENLQDLGHADFMAKPLDWRELSRAIQGKIES
ncbi:response regulator [Pontiella sulfatireligans]|uniref:histidine kinase n=1 Tax=Pontiella sulfatireligans TaxID=2750658 RepID=A0A6C2ULT1_9BACT|nr:response regulator [Pontiella sulfatireligans]VGO21222.1 Sensor kinase CckA [Pontiella sulfatireligans]